MVTINMLSGLPPYGPMATAFPREWGRLGREGTVVEFQAEAGPWVGNFQSGREEVTAMTTPRDGRGWLNETERAEPG
jgi:hypothetical protein